MAKKGQPGRAGKGKGKGKGKAGAVDKRQGAAVARGVACPVAVRDLTTVFEREPDEDVKRRKADAALPLQRLGNDDVIVVSAYACPVEDDERHAADTARRAVIRLPLPRPPWEGLSQEVVHAQEWKFFHEWLTSVYKEHDRAQLNFFEHNFEVWRQIWRTIERADAFVFVVDVRKPLFHFSLALYRFLSERFDDEVGGSGPGNIIVVINKVDLVPPECVAVWSAYFSERFPRVKVVPFYVPKSGSAQVSDTDSVGELLGALRSVRVAKKVDGRLRAVSGSKFFGSRRSADAEPTEEEAEQRFRHPGMLTVALVGDPNMGKSSIINALFGKKVVSSSATPGHTKHFQTHFLPLGRLTGTSVAGEVLSNVCFMDSPGIVVPKSDVPRALQVIFGSYRVANLREPYSVIRWLMESGVGLIGRYALEQHRDGQEPWTPLSVCEAYARKRSFFTRKGAPEPYRAANNILRDVLNGRGVVAFYLPPGCEDELPRIREAARAFSATSATGVFEADDETLEEGPLSGADAPSDTGVGEGDLLSEESEVHLDGGARRQQKNNAFLALASESEGSSSED